MRTVMMGSGLALALLLLAALSVSPEAEASPFTVVDGTIAPDVYVGFGYSSTYGRRCGPCCGPRRAYVRTVPYYYSTYPGYYHGYWSRPYYAHHGYGYPRATVGITYGYSWGGHRHHYRGYSRGYYRGHSRGYYRGHSRGYYRGHHRHGARRVVGRRR